MTNPPPIWSRLTIPHPGAPPSGRPYSPGLLAGPFLFISGQLGVDPVTDTVVSNDLAEQTRRALENVVSLLRVAGLDVTDVVKTTVYLTRQEDFAAMNAVYREVFPEPWPARSTVIVAALTRPEYLVEIEAIALRNTG